MNTESAKRAVAEEIWLNYYNRYLLDHGMISEPVYRKMQSLIRSRTYKSKQHFSSAVYHISMLLSKCEDAHLVKIGHSSMNQG